MESILTSIKKLLGIMPDYTHFDADLIMHINSVFSILQQLGVGPTFSISDATTTWSEYTERTDIEMIKSYMAQKVKLMFDPPLSSVAVDAMKNQIAEFEWRLNVAVDPGEPQS